MYHLTLVHEWHLCKMDAEIANAWAEADANIGVSGASAYSSGTCRCSEAYLLGGDERSGRSGRHRREGGKVSVELSLNRQNYHRQRSNPRNYGTTWWTSFNTIGKFFTDFSSYNDLKIKVHISGIKTFRNIHRVLGEAGLLWLHCYNRNISKLVHDTRVYRGNDVSTDHFLQITEVAIPT